MINIKDIYSVLLNQNYLNSLSNLVTWSTVESFYIFDRSNKNVVEAWSKRWILYNNFYFFSISIVNNYYLVDTMSMLLALSKNCCILFTKILKKFLCILLYKIRMSIYWMLRIFFKLPFSFNCVSRAKIYNIR